MAGHRRTAGKTQLAPGVVFGTGHKTALFAQGAWCFHRRYYPNSIRFNLYPAPWIGSESVGGEPYGCGATSNREQRPGRSARLILLLAAPRGARGCVGISPLRIEVGECEL